MKYQCLTLVLSWILAVLSRDEVAGMSGVAVKCVEITQNTNCEGRLLGPN
jgi:hypothetical protein